MSKSVSVTTTNNLEGHAIEEYLGVIRGIAVRSSSGGIFGSNIRA